MDDTTMFSGGAAANQEESTVTPPLPVRLRTKCLSRICVFVFCRSWLKSNRVCGGISVRSDCESERATPLWILDLVCLELQSFPPRTSTRLADKSSVDMKVSFRFVTQFVFSFFATPWSWMKYVLPPLRLGTSPTCPESSGCQAEY